MDPGTSQDFRLTWVNYSQKLTESFHKFLTSEILCNVTLWVHESTGGSSGSASGTGSSIKAHQAILSACSPWFEKILSQNQHPHPIIILKDVRYHDLKNIIRFIYTGEVFVPQHDLQDFLRTAELLEIKGLLKDDAAWPPQGLASLFQTPLSPGPQKHQHQQIHQQQQTLPNLPTVPVSSLLLPVSGPGSTAGVVATDAAGGSGGPPIIHDLVSQIKVPVSLPCQPLSKTILGVQQQHACQPLEAPQSKRRKLDLLNRRLTTTTHPKLGQQRRICTNNTSSQLVVEDTGGPTGPLLPQTAVEEDAVSWIEESAGQCTESAMPAAPAGDQPALTPAEWVATGINDCGAFKRLWAERYLCYNLGREIICLLCFCRFTQFKKFNLERHMKNKHPQMFSMNESARRQILERFVARYIDHVSPSDNPLASSSEASSSHPGQEQRSHDVASEILAIGPIQLEDVTASGEEAVGEVLPSVATQAVVSDSEMNAIKVEGDHDELTGPGTSKEARDPGSRPPDNIMVELEETDSEMLLVK